MGRIRSFEFRRQRPVLFKLPNGDRKYLRLEAEVSCDRKWAHGDYRFLLQELVDPEGDWGRLLRMTYYRRPHGGDDSSWHFGGQWSITASRDVWVELLKKGASENWFRDILPDAQITSGAR